MAALGWGLGLLAGALMAFGAQRLRGNAARTFALLGLLLALGGTLPWLTIVFHPTPKGGALLAMLLAAWLLGLVVGLPRAIARRGHEPSWTGLGLGLLLIVGGVLMVLPVARLPSTELDGVLGYGLTLGLIVAATLAALLDRRRPA